MRIPVLVIERPVPGSVDPGMHDRVGFLDAAVEVDEAELGVSIGEGGMRRTPPLPAPACIRRRPAWSRPGVLPAGHRGHIPSTPAPVGVVPDLPDGRPEEIKICLPVHLSVATAAR